MFSSFFVDVLLCFNLGDSPRSPRHTDWRHLLVYKMWSLHVVLGRELPIHLKHKLSGTGNQGTMVATPVTHLRQTPANRPFSEDGQRLQGWSDVSVK